MAFTERNTPSGRSSAWENKKMPRDAVTTTDAWRGVHAWGARIRFQGNTLVERTRLVFSRCSHGVNLKCVCSACVCVCGAISRSGVGGRAERTSARSFAWHGSDPAELPSPLDVKGRHRGIAIPRLRGQEPIPTTTTTTTSHWLFIALAWSRRSDGWSGRKEREERRDASTTTVIRTTVSRVYLVKQSINKHSSLSPHSLLLRSQLSSWVLSLSFPPLCSTRLTATYLSSRCELYYSEYYANFLNAHANKNNVSVLRFKHTKYQWL